MGFFVSVALAAPIFGVPGATVKLDPGGNWPRSFPIVGTERFALMNAAAGGYHYEEVDLSLKVVPNSRRDLSNHGDELDHGLAACPDGTFVHAATAHHGSADDSVYLQRLDAQFRVILETEPVDRDPEVQFLDPAVVCTSWTWGFAGMVMANPRDPMRFYALDAAGEVAAVHRLDAGPDANGASFWADDSGLWAVGTRFEEPEFMWLGMWGADLTPLPPRRVPVAPEGFVAYWYQRLIKVGDVWIVAHMAHAEADRFNTQTGDVWLTAFDPDWNVIDQVQLTDLAPPDGAFHPWVVQREDQLLVNYTYALSNYGLYVPIDLAATEWPDPVDTGDPAGDTGGDTGSDDSGLGDSGSGGDDPATADSGEPGDAPDCGCVSGGAPAFGIAGVGALVVVARRRRVTVRSPGRQVGGAPGVGMG